MGEFSKAAANVIAGAAPSVVGVGPAGSGVVIGDALVVTNAHNLRGEISVTFEDGRVATATVAGADLDGVGLDPHAAAAPVAELAARHVAVERRLVELQARGHALEHARETRAMRFAGRGET